MEIEKPKGLEFKMGRLIINPETKFVSPDKSRGQLRLRKQDGEKHLSWINLDTNKQQIELMIFENDAHFQIMPKRKNVLVLWFESYEDKYFFWLQESGLKIEEVEKKVQGFINDQEDEEPQPSSAEKKEEAPAAQSKPAQKPGSSGIDLSFIEGLQKKLEMQRGKSKEPESEPIKLIDIMNKDFLKWAAENYDQKFLKHLPEGQQIPGEYKDTIHSPQLLQAIDALDDALNSQGVLAIFHEMGLDQQFLHQHYGVQAFLKALEKWGKQNPS